jgi:uncharacterized protein
MIGITEHAGTLNLGDKGFLKQGPLLWLRSVAWMVGFSFLLVLSFGPLGQFTSDMLPQDELGLRFFARVFGALMALAVYVLLVRYVEKRAATELSIKAAPRELALGLMLGVLMFSAVMAILVWSGMYEVSFKSFEPAWKPAGAAIEAGIVEELIVRGVILRLLWRAFGPAVAFAGSAILFGAGHIPNSGATLFAAVCIAIEAGVMLGAFYALTGRIWVSIGIHAAWNFTQGYVFGAAVSGGSLGASIATSTAMDGKPDWLTGGAFGPEASLAALAICGTVGLAAMWLAWKAGRFSKLPASQWTQTRGRLPAPKCGSEMSPFHPDVAISGHPTRP